MAGKSRQRNELLLVEALARGEKITEAAKLSGLSERTAHRRLKEKLFVQKIREHRVSMLENASAQLTTATEDAVATLRSLLNANSESTRLSAARSILELSSKFREAVDTESRLTILENRSINQKNHSNDEIPARFRT